MDVLPGPARAAPGLAPVSGDVCFWPTAECWKNEATVRGTKPCLAAREALRGSVAQAGRGHFVACHRREGWR